jgi:hypothetical protein
MTYDKQAFTAGKGGYHESWFSVNSYTEIYAVAAKAMPDTDET